ncbi:MAG: helix-turn-helix domain-containing protein [Chloroflexi bacterium]|nr:helix-turn-helix domain-containing protein [Chloroflexota bacterium]
MSALRARITISDVWHLALPPGTRLVGGAAGLENPVEWVTSLRAAFPLFGAMEAGYLALARPELARRIDPRLTFRYLLTELHRVGASGLVIDEPISADEAALADRLGLPVLLLPAGADLGLVERDVLRTLVDHEGQLARREMEARQRLLQLYASGGLSAVLQEVSTLTSAEVLVYEESGAVLSHIGQVRASEGLEPSSPPREETFPIVVGGKALGQLVLRSSEGERGALPARPSHLLIAVYGRQAAEVCGLEILQQRTRQETEERLGFDLVEQLLDPAKGEEAIVARLARLGYDLSADRRHVAIAVGAASRQVRSDLCETVAQDVHWAARNDGASAVIARYRGDLLLFCSLPPDLPDRRIREWLRQALRSGTELCSVGVGRIGEGIPALQRSVRQALRAREVGRHVASLQSPYFYEQMGLYRLLTELQGRDELARFYDETLGDLVRYDQAHHTDLVHTLRVFFAENANASRTARVLYVHRNTLNYRLQRIIEITGLDLNDAEARLALQLALKIHELVP